MLIFIHENTNLAMRTTETKKIIYVTFLTLKNFEIESMGGGLLVPVPDHEQMSSYVKCLTYILWPNI